MSHAAPEMSTTKQQPPALALANCSALLRENELEHHESQQVIEDIATGGRLTCPSCEKTMPCMCEHQ